VERSDAAECQVDSFSSSSAVPQYLPHLELGDHVLGAGPSLFEPLPCSIADDLVARTSGGALDSGYSLVATVSDEARVPFALLGLSI
jgi:hypothetical protein